MTSELIRLISNRERKNQETTAVMMENSFETWQRQDDPFTRIQRDGGRVQPTALNSVSIPELGGRSQGWEATSEIDKLDDDGDSGGVR